MEFLEVAGDDGDGEREDEDSGDGTHGAHQLAQAGDGEDVAIANSGHCDHHPVKGRRDGSESGVFFYLNEVAEAGEDEAADTDKEDEETELLVALLECVDNSLESRRVSRQLEDSGQLEDAEDLEDVVHGTFLLVIQLPGAWCGREGRHRVWVPET